MEGYNFNAMEENDGVRFSWHILCVCLCSLCLCVCINPRPTTLVARRIVLLLLWRVMCLTPYPFQKHHTQPPNHQGQRTS